MDKTLLAATIAANIPETMIPGFVQCIKEMPDNKLATLAAVQMKSPSVTVILACFLGSLGIDRFYLGQSGTGIAKLLTGGGCGIWALVDIFTAVSRAKQANYDKLQLYLR